MNNNMDTLLSLVELNKVKYNILTKMKNLELKNGINTKEFKELINNYKLTSSFYNKKLLNINEDDKMELINIIALLNSDKDTSNSNYNYADLLNSDDKILVLRKTTLDLGHSLLLIYNKLELPGFLGYLFDQQTSEVDSEMINKLMVSQFNHELISSINDAINTLQFNNEELMLWKYNLIFLYKEIEERVVNNDFIILKDINYVNINYVSNYGLSKEEYIDNADVNFAEWLSKLIISTVRKAQKDKNLDINLIDILFIDTLANLITDKDVHRGLLMVVDEEAPDNLVKTVKIIDFILCEAISKDNKKELIKK